MNFTFSISVAAKNKMSGTAVNEEPQYEVLEATEAEVNVANIPVELDDEAQGVIRR